jgi:NAD(P)-dependent dehydrogenase (short-subunit alcohol dehydrogenase family)
MLLRGRTLHVSGDDGTLTDALLAHGAELAGPEGPVDVVVHVVAGDLDEVALADLTAEAWDRRCDAPIRDAIDAAQAAHARMAGAGGHLVFVTPSFGLTGAAGLVPLATAAEGVRSLTKTAARQFGADGIRVSCVARRVAGPVVAIPTLDDPSIEDVAGAVALLASEAASGVTGATLVVDGGTVLVP